MGERIQLRGGWYEFIEPDEEEEMPEDQKEFWLPVPIINKMAVFCRYNNTGIPQ